MAATSWADGQVARSVRHERDGLGRVLRTSSWADGVEDATSVSTYAYDQPSGIGRYHRSRYVLGQLSHAHSAARDLFLGYDAFGNLMSTSQVADDGARVEAYRYYRLDGQISQIRYFMPHNQVESGDWEVELVRYGFDSAQRVKTVTWRDETMDTSKTIFEAREITPLGQYERVRYGNGVEEDLQAPRGRSPRARRAPGVGAERVAELTPQ